MIHLLNATNIVLKGCRIRPRDDCISIIAGSSNIKIESIQCVHGHGISIGSLGKDNATDFVEEIHLNGAYFRNTTNGVRIKSWQAYDESRYVDNILECMEDLVMLRR